MTNFESASTSKAFMWLRFLVKEKTGKNSDPFDSLQSSNTGRDVLQCSYCHIYCLIDNPQDTTCFLIKYEGCSLILVTCLIIFSVDNQ